jgi:translation initiation factor 2 alpha subunit (eIF-2alpha)
MSELKSAWEVAQERANRLGKLSADEKEQQERESYRQAGQALARKWLDGPQSLDIVTELGKHEEEGKETMNQAIIEHLVEVIQLTATKSVASVQGIIEAIISLKPQLQPRAEELGQLLQEYESAEEKIRQQLESQYRETLHQLRISGTAVDAASMEGNPQWELARQELEQSFAPRLTALKQALLDT